MPYEFKKQSAGDLIKADDWNAMGLEIFRLGASKLDREGNDVVNGPLSIKGDVTVGSANQGAALRVLRKQEDGSDPVGHGALVLGSDTATSASLRLGYNAANAWAQAQGVQKTLAINPFGGNVGVGTDKPKSRLSVTGGVGIGATYATANAAPDNSLVVEGNIGVGTPTPQARLHVAQGDIRVDASREVLFADNGQIRSANDTHRILFRREENKLELREYGDIVFSSGATNGAETAKMAVKADGKVAIGIAKPAAQLHVSKYMAVGPYSAGEFEGRLEVSGQGAELAFMRRSLTAWPDSPKAGDRFVWYNQDGNARLWTHVNGDLLTVTADGSLRWSNRSTLRNDQGGSLELGGNEEVAGTGTPYIDFHYNGKKEDYNARIINDGDGQLSVFASTLRLGRFSLAAASENVRLVRGNVRSDGAIVSGSGFTIAHRWSGIYDINFSEAFSSAPSGSVTQVYPGFDSGDGEQGGWPGDSAVIVGISTTRMRVKTGDGGGQNVTPRNFTFLVIGPR